MTLSCTSPFLPAWKVWPQTHSTHFHPIPPQFRWGDWSIPYPIYLPPGGKEEQPPTPLYQNEVREQSQVVPQFLSESTHQSPNYREEVVALAYISGLQVAHPLYKHLLKPNITKMSMILTRGQPFIQLEEAMKASSDHLAKLSDGRRKSKSPREDLDHPPDRYRG